MDELIVTLERGVRPKGLVLQLQVAKKLTVYVREHRAHQSVWAFVLKYCYFKPVTHGGLLISVADQIRVSPNPCAGQFTISLPAAWQQQAVHATLLSCDGRIVQDQQFAATSSKNVSLGNTPSGTYYLRIENKTSGKTALLIILIMN